MYFGFCGGNGGDVVGFCYFVCWLGGWLVGWWQPIFLSLSLLIFKSEHEHKYIVLSVLLPLFFIMVILSLWLLFFLFISLIM